MAENQNKADDVYGA